MQHSNKVFHVNAHITRQFTIIRITTTLLLCYSPSDKQFCLPSIEMRATQELAVNNVSEAAMIGGNKCIFKTRFCKIFAFLKQKSLNFSFVKYWCFCHFYRRSIKLNMERDCNTASVKCFLVRSVGILELYMCIYMSSFTLDLRSKNKVRFQFV